MLLLPSHNIKKQYNSHNSETQTLIKYLLNYSPLTIDASYRQYSNCESMIWMTADNNELNGCTCSFTDRAKPLA